MARNFDRITQNPAVLEGRATIRELSISVAHVVNLVANGMTPAQIIGELPDLDEEDIRPGARLRRGVGRGRTLPAASVGMRLLADAGVSPKTVTFLQEVQAVQRASWWGGAEETARAAPQASEHLGLRPATGAPA